MLWVADLAQEKRYEPPPPRLSLSPASCLPLTHVCAHTPACARALHVWGCRGTLRRCGALLRIADLAEKFGFTDADGRQPPPFVLPEVGAAG